MLANNCITTTNNLLAFSGGVDSTALFFLLLEQNIPFDIAIVNYHQRKQANEEVAYAKELAKKYDKKCFVADFEEDKFSEKSARDFRYNFFDTLIEQNNYDSLITAHQLNDKLEWFFMQLSKGAGLNELNGLEELSYRNNYIVYRPLIKIQKNELLEYLEVKNIKYFMDETNSDSKYKRNHFRKEFSDKFLAEYSVGVIKSFEYMQNDIDTLNNLYTTKQYEELTIATFDKEDLNLMIGFIDREAKQRGILLSKRYNG
jgi:tRNA(Ile)-lysidine synthase